MTAMPCLGDLQSHIAMYRLHDDTPCHSTPTLSFYYCHAFHSIQWPLLLQVLDKYKADYIPAEIVSEEWFTYTIEEEPRVCWELNLIVFPLLFLYIFQLERGSISNALTDG